MDLSTDGATADHSAPAADTGRGFLGCGLSGLALVEILTAAVALFLFWNGPLWAAPPGASHVGRIVLSYLVVLPLVAAALLLARRWSWVHLLSAVGLIWGAKLVVTSSLYSYLASGAVQKYSPAPVVAEPGRTPVSHPVVAPSAVGSAELSGVVRDHGRALAGVVVVAQADGPLSAGRRTAMAIRGSRYDRSVYLATVRDTLVVENGDGVLHNVRAHRDHRTLWNVPAAPGAGERILPASEAGVYELSCDEHPSERATLVVVDRAPATTTDAAGRFTLSGLPAGDVQLDLFHDSASPRQAHAALTAGARAEVVLDFAELEPKR